jgi:hypothetical protein
MPHLHRHFVGYFESPSHGWSPACVITLVAHSVNLSLSPSEMLSTHTFVNFHGCKIPRMQRGTFRVPGCARCKKRKIKVGAHLLQNAFSIVAFINPSHSAITVLPAALSAFD